MTYLSVSPDQLATAGAYVSREWGDYGYSLDAISSPTTKVSVFTWRCGDGGRFRVAVDRWSNCRHIPDSAGDAEYIKILSEMHEHATAA
jgi:hypothetical protein